VQRDRIDVSNDVVKAFWRWENQDAVHVTLVSTLEYLDDEGRQEADRRALGELSALGLAANGHVRPELRATIQALTRPDVEFYGWVGTPQQMVGMLVAARGGVAVLAVAHGQGVTLCPVRPDGLAEALIDHLPVMPPAQGRSINVLESDLTGSGRHSQEDGFAGFAAVGESADVRMMKALMAQPPLGGGQLHVAARGRDGRRHTCPAPITYVDVPEGRWLTQVTTNGSGQNWVIATPATSQLLVAKLYEMYRALSASV
jgi:EspG family